MEHDENEGFRNVVNQLTSCGFGKSRLEEAMHLGLAMQQIMSASYCLTFSCEKENDYSLRLEIYKPGGTEIKIKESDTNFGVALDRLSKQAAVYGLKILS